MMRTAILTPAYGRSYKKIADVNKDFDGNRDFILHDPTSQWDGRYCNKADLTQDYTHVQIRYDKHRREVHVRTVLNHP